MKPYQTTYTFAQIFSLLLAIAIFVCGACREASPAVTGTPTPKQPPDSAPPPSSIEDTCPAYDTHTDPFSNVTELHRTAAYWRTRFSEQAQSETLLSEAEIDRHNRAVGQSGILPVSQWNLLQPMSQAELESQLQQRLNAISEQVENNTLVTADGNSLAPHQQQFLKRESGSLLGDARPGAIEVALEVIQMRCVPYDGGLYRADSDKAFDKNACSAVHPQEPLEILGRWKNEMLFVRTRYAFGFIRTDSRRAPKVPEKWRSTYMNGAGLFSAEDSTVQCDSRELMLPKFTVLPQTAEGKMLVAAESAYCVVPVSPSFHSTSRPLTRGAFYDTAFEFLDTAYGYGGTDGGLDCSRFVMDVLATFDISMPRNSKHQSMAGAYAIDVSMERDPARKQRLLDTAQEKGVVALYFPGHIMLYLGKTEDGVPMAIHSLGEYASPCGAHSETVFRVKKVVVTDLSLGAGSSRHSFLERLTRIVVFSNRGENDFTVPLSHRPAAPPTHIPEACEDSVTQRIFQSPRRLIVDEPARLIATGSAPLHHAVMRIFDKQGRPVSGTSFFQDGPPFTHWTEFTPTAAGKYTAVLGDGDIIYACDHFGVGSYRSKKKTRTEPGPYWQSRWKWEQDTENLFSAFVTRLFDFPRDADVSWNGLHDLLSDPQHNLLFNHLGQNEDVELNLSPDCADLPYFLRAYFSWKTGLPFGVRSCSRGRKGRPPSCTEFQSNQLVAPHEEELDSEAKIFDRFANVVIGWNAHSASGRTHPKFNDTDYYPVPLSREALIPGTIFADPYGHIMILTKWYPQPAGGYGVLMAVDAQPDGTIGRRRFWRGTFLFDARTDSFGAGFKRFRPVVVKTEPMVDEAGATIETELVTTLNNKDLQRSRVFPRYSMMQYEAGTEAFYDRMQALINPAPLNAEDLLRSRIDALEESVIRRVQAVANGESFIASREYAPIEMPEDSDIFQTTGPWEDFSTPSRDMRLLIAIDAVIETPKKVFQIPTQFGFSQTDDLTSIVSGLQSMLDAELEQRSFTYIRSNGSVWTLTLSDVVRRQQALEMGYNPNDCVELRWGAPEGSDEHSSCRRTAPDEQTKRMDAYRIWFHTRTRPQRQ
ncbi:MAG: C40 family peptidase [Deltaproteobacteria bacterium]|nr:C40 family peptidase [Deltaproteobacteria bacterium]MBN2670424.1 C40 family peptidase [Deltaproteobacteria bacterium]